MRLVQTNIAQGWYQDEALSWAAMRTVNYLPEAAESEGTRTVGKLATPPGLRAIVDLGTNAPVRGIEDVEGRLFAVSGSSLFEITSDLAKINRGSIPGVGRVSMAHNKQGGAAAANELAIANGLSGYVYNTATTVLTQITDSAFEGASTFDYIDGYNSFTDPQGRFWGHSELNQATQYSSVDRYDAESAPDKITSHIVSHREVIVWGPRTGEFFRNTGAATGTFQRVDGTEMEVGICSTFARARVDNTVCWVGNDMTVYRLEGHSPRRISTRPIEQVLSRVDPNNVFCYAWEDRGHKVFYVTSPGNFTLGFDFSSGLWHERESYGLNQWRVNALTRWNGLWVAGDYVNGLLYALDWDIFTENGQPMVSEAATGYTWTDQNKVLAAYAELIFDTGGATRSAYPLSLSGDLSDGMVGDVGSYSYLSSGGILPHTFSLASGSLPPGATLGTNGTVTYDYLLAGSYSWTVEVTDANGSTAQLPDSAVIGVQPMLLVAQPTGGGGSNKEAILSPDGTTWNATPVTTGGALNDALYVIGLPGRYWGGLNAAVGAAYAPAAGTPWTSVTLAGNASAPGQAYSAGRLFIPGQGLSTNYRYSDDLGVTSSSGSLKAGYFAARNNLGALAALKWDVSPERVIETTDKGATWSPGVGLPANMSFGGPGCSGWGGDGYYFGASNPAGTTPRLVRVIGGVLTAITLPTLTGATRISAYAYGNNTRVFGTDNGLLLFDNGGGLTAAATTLPANVLQLLWNGAVFVALSQSGSGGVGTIWTSPTGNVWTQRSMYAGKTLWSVAQLRGS